MPSKKHRHRNNVKHCQRNVVREMLSRKCHQRNIVKEMSEKSHQKNLSEYLCHKKVITDNICKQMSKENVVKKNVYLLLFTLSGAVDDSIEVTRVDDK